jgi:hypothetical protein
LARDLYSLNQENKAFLDARYLAPGSRLGPYENIIDEAVYPDVYKNKPIQVAVAKRAIAQYAKATGDEAGTLELMVHFVECGNQFTVDFGDIDEAFYSALESMFGRILGVLKRSGPEVVESFLPRLTAVRDAAQGIGWGYSDYLREALSEAFPRGFEEGTSTHG